MYISTNVLYTHCAGITLKLKIWDQFNRSVITRKEGRKEGRKEKLYLVMHSIHFMYGYMASDMVKDHYDGKRGNLLPPLYELQFLISSKGSFICTIQQTG